MREILNLLFHANSTNALVYLFVLFTSDEYLTRPVTTTKLELELELHASADPSHPTDDNGEESYSLYIPFCPLDGDLITV